MRSTSPSEGRTTEARSGATSRPVGPRRTPMVEIMSEGEEIVYDPTATPSEVRADEASSLRRRAALKSAADANRFAAQRKEHEKEERNTKVLSAEEIARRKEQSARDKAAAKGRGRSTPYGFRSFGRGSGRNLQPPQKGKGKGKAKRKDGRH